MKASYILLFTLLTAAPTYAKLGSSNGFSGELSLNTGYISTQSHLNTNANAILTGLDQTAETDDTVIVAPLGNLAYTFGRSNQQVYFGTTRDDIAIGTLALQLGYKYQFPSRMTVDIAYLPTVMSGSEWQNPYETTTARQETDVDGNAYRLKLSNIGGSLFSLDMAYADKEVEQDTLVNTALARDAKTFLIKGQVRIPLSRTTMLLPAIAYIESDAQGEANSYQGYRGELSLFQSIGEHNIALTAAYSQHDYQAGNHLFGNQIRNDDGLKFFVAYEYQNLMGWQNWSFISFVGYSQTDANINFYDESQSIVTLGVNYKF
ncbi:DUF2860 domain-containing protein [Vibrio genomosp. F10]|uniref:DUF2860 domain-containing protein n=1 Tax=Vibrio genomosp. F10 TaxID=723171 RepID=UPI000312CF66|nr:DUF2860 domain-containing protein [Vibrio genomosp. F10]OEF07982.1 hypothetical protein A1QI_04720 [Vibrio genomosp. F10 str. 9ZB36]